MIESSRYAPTCSFTPGWSRTIWPAETPRMATWLWPGPRFCTVNPATLAATPSMLSTPRRCSCCSVGAATEKGTSSRVCSRRMAVTVTSSWSCGSSENSTAAGEEASTLRSRFVWRPKPFSATVTE